MNISIEVLRQTASNEWLLELSVASDRLESVIRESTDGELEGFSIEDSCVKDVLSLCGLEGRFARDFFRYKETHDPVLPWNYGDQDEATLIKVLAHHRVR